MMSDPWLHPNVQAACNAGVNPYLAKLLDTQISPDPMDWVDFVPTEAKSRCALLATIDTRALPDEIAKTIRQAICEYESIGELIWR